MSLASTLRVLSLALVGALLLAGCSAGTRTTAPAFGLVPNNVSEMEVDGVRVIHRRCDSANHIIVAKLFLRGGWSAVPMSQSVALEWLTLKTATESGPADRSGACAPDAYQHQLDRIATTISASAGRDASTVTMRCIDETFDSSWKLFTGVVTSPGFDTNELASARMEQITAIRDRGQHPESYANYLADSVFFHGHPYGRFPQIEGIGEVKPADLAAHARELFVKKRMVLVVVGNIDSADLRRRVAASLATLPEGSYTPPVIPTRTPNADSSIVVLRRPLSGGSAVTNYMVVRFAAPDRNHPDYFAMQRMVSMLSGDIYNEVRVKNNLSYAPYANYYAPGVGFGEITVSTVKPTQVWNMVRDESIGWLKEYMVPAEGFDSRNMNAKFTSYFMAQWTNDDQADQLGYSYLSFGNWRTAFTSVNEGQQVTPRDVRWVAQQYLKNYTIVVVGDPDAFKP